MEKYDRVYRPEVSAQSLIDSLFKGEQTMSCGDVGVNILTRGTNGMWPRNNTLADFLVAPWLVLLAKLYTAVMWDREVMKDKYAEARGKHQAESSSPQNLQARSNSMSEVVSEKDLHELDDEKEKLA